jgi:uracil-DNA glycosylase
MNLSEFRSQLQKIEKRLPGRTSWPFLCRGSPLTCRIFIVGANPATQDEMRFWDFWTPGSGFRKTEFLRERGGQSKTRTCIEIFSDAAGRNITLETNIYPYATPKKKDLIPEQKRTDIFEYLLHTIKPRIVLAHGNEAKQFFSERGITLVEDRLKSINLDGLRIKLLPRKHLSYHTSHEEARKIGQKLARALG